MASCLPYSDFYSLHHPWAAKVKCQGWDTDLCPWLPGLRLVVCSGTCRVMNFMGALGNHETGHKLEPSSNSHMHCPRTLLGAH